MKWTGYFQIANDMMEIAGDPGPLINQSELLRLSKARHATPHPETGSLVFH
jgi:hypothetical protein